METFWRVQFFSGTLHASPTPHSLKWSAMLCSLALWSHVSSKNKHSHKNRKTAESLDTRRIKTIQPGGQDWKSASEMLETSPDQWDAGYFFCLFAWRQRPLLSGGRHSRAGMRGEFSFFVFRARGTAPSSSSSDDVSDVEWVSVVDEAGQRLPLVVGGGEQGWHSGRAPLTLGSAQRCSVLPGGGASVRVGVRRPLWIWFAAAVLRLVLFVFGLVVVFVVIVFVVVLLLLQTRRKKDVRDTTSSQGCHSALSWQFVAK